MKVKDAWDLALGWFGTHAAVSKRVELAADWLQHWKQDPAQWNCYNEKLDLQKLNDYDRYYREGLRDRPPVAKRGKASRGVSMDIKQTTKDRGTHKKTEVENWRTLSFDKTFSPQKAFNLVIDSDVGISSLFDLFTGQLTCDASIAS